MTSEESNGQDGTGKSGLPPHKPAIDKESVLAHLRQQLEELAKEAEADNGNA